VRKTQRHSSLRQSHNAFSLQGPTIRKETGCCRGRNGLQEAERCLLPCRNIPSASCLRLFIGDSLANEDGGDDEDEEEENNKDGSASEEEQNADGENDDA